MIVNVKAHPKSSKNEVVQVDDFNYIVYTTAPPANNQANMAIVKLLSQHFKIAKSQITIIGGQSYRNKLIQIDER